MFGIPSYAVNATGKDGTMRSMFVVQEACGVRTFPVSFPDPLKARLSFNPLHAVQNVVRPSDTS